MAQPLIEIDAVQTALQSTFDDYQVRHSVYLATLGKRCSVKVADNTVHPIMRKIVKERKRIYWCLLSEAS